jgi:WS/DGAT/MGAT family acyltransferase
MSSHTDTVTGTMSDSDALLWSIGRDPVLRTTIVAVLALDRAPRFGEVRAALEALTNEVPRLRSRVSPPPLGWGRPTWVADDGFDIDLHLRRMTAPPPATFRTVLDLAQAMATVAFDPVLPLWEAAVVEGVDGERAALVIKLHHAVVDGVGGLAVALRLLSRHRRAPAAGTPGFAPPRGAAPAEPGRGRPREAVPIVALRNATGRAVATTARALDLARTAAGSPLGQLARARAGARSVARLLAPAGAPLSPIMTGRSIRRRFEVLDLDPGQLRQACRAGGATVNDVFVTGVLGGLGRYHREQGAPVDRLRVLMPVNVRSAAHADGGNHFVPARFVLPLPDDPARCLRQVHDIAGSWKHAPGLGMSDVLAAALDVLPPPLLSAVWGSMLKGDDFVTTNVPGPPFETYLAGARVDGFYAFAPPSGAALNVALVTPAGRACVGINLDAAAVPDPVLMTDCLRKGFDEVMGLGAPRARVSA